MSSDTNPKEILRYLTKVKSNLERTPKRWKDSVLDYPQHVAIGVMLGRRMVMVIMVVVMVYLMT
jgi:hypothetical protein